MITEKQIREIAYRHADLAMNAKSISYAQFIIENAIRQAIYQNNGTPEHQHSDNCVCTYCVAERLDRA